MLCCPHCSQLSTILNNIVTPDSGSTVLFNIVWTSVTNVGSATLFNPVKQQAHYVCIHIDATLYTLLHALHVIRIIEDLLYIEALYVKHCILLKQFYGLF
jgi:hypothetical protein